MTAATNSATDLGLAPGLYESVRRVITVVDELRDAGLQQYVTLPRIAVVGTQSGGKSSVLESIVGADFLPRGDGVVTRRPLELRLVHLTPTGADTPQTWSVFATEPSKKYYSFSEVKDEIIRQTELIAGKNKGIVDDPIVLTVYSATCPDLTLIDLPGITRVPVKNSDQREDIEKITKDMAMRYITDPRTIILAVVPANQDMSTSDALQMARQVDPQGVRTIGVITKLDIMDPGTDAVKMLLGEEIGLRLGFVGIKNRGQADIRAEMKVQDALDNERRWFSEHPKYGKLPPGYTGTDTLVEKLTKILFRHIRSFLPSIKKEVSERKIKVKERLSQLGEGVPENLQEQVQLIWGLITDYCDIIKNGIRGKYDRRLQTYLTNDTPLQQLPGQQPGQSQLPGQSGVSGMIAGLFGNQHQQQQFQGGRASSSQQMSGGAQIRQIFNQFLADFEEQKITATMTDDDIDMAIRMHEGDSLPGFPSPDIFEFLILPHLKRVSDPSIECVQTVAQTLEQLSQRIARNVFKRFPKLAESVLDLTAAIINRELDNTRGVIENIVDLETGYLFTNDPSYLTNHGSMRKITDGALQNGAAPAPAVAAPAPVAQPGAPSSGISSMIPSFGGQKKAMAGYGGAYVAEIRARLDSYFGLVVRNIRDSVPKAVGFFLVRQVQEKLQFELYTALNKSDVIADLLGEPEFVRNERRQLHKQLQVLENSANVLARDPAIAAIQLEGVGDDIMSQTTTNNSMPAQMPAQTGMMVNQNNMSNQNNMMASQQQYGMPQSPYGAQTASKAPAAATFAPPKPKPATSLFDDMPAVKRPANPLFD